MNETPARLWDLRLGDNLDRIAGLPSLASRSVDHTIQDPPYEQEAHSAGRRLVMGTFAEQQAGARRVEIKQIAYPPITEAERRAIARHTARVTRRWILTFCQIEAAHLWRAAYEAAGARYVRTGIWIKTDAQPQYSGDRPGVGYEAIVICHGTEPRRRKIFGGRMRWNGGGRCARWEFSSRGTGGQLGQTKLVDGQKPLALMEALVSDFTEPGELILDPYAGSATTLRAAACLGRRALGWERLPAHHEIAARLLQGQTARPAGGPQLALLG